MGYIDIHSHILFGVDDGSQSYEESVEMLHKAYNEGFTTIIATPHFSKGFGDYTHELVAEQCEILTNYAKDNISDDFCILPGQEIYLNETSLRKIQNGEVIPLAKSKYILLELPTTITYPALLKKLREVEQSPYFVVLAHIERYSCLQDFDKIAELKERGILMKMNYSAIREKWFHASTIFSKNCLKRGLIDFLATDMHDTVFRNSKSETAFLWMKKNLDEAYIKKITKDNALEILSINK